MTDDLQDRSDEGRAESTFDALLGWMREGPSGLRAKEEELEGDVEERLGQALLAEGVISEVGQLALAVLVVVITWESLDGLALAGWLGTVVAAVLFRRFFPVWVASRDRGGRAITRAVRTGVVLPAAAWGGGLLIVAPALAFQELALIMAAFAGMVAASLNTLSADPRSLQGFVSTLLGGLVLALLRHGQSRLHWVAVILVVIFGGVVVILSLRAFRIIRDRLETAKSLELQETSAQRDRSFLAALIQSVPDALVALHRNGRILGVNRGFQEVFGWAPEEAIGQDLNELIVPPDERDQARDLDVALFSGGVVIHEMERRRKDGQSVHVRVSAAPVEDVPDVMVAVYSDITRLKETEAALAGAKEMAEAANQAKSEFLATMSHEIRTPLNAIIGMAELLDETDLSTQQRDYVQVFRTAGDTLLNLINEVLDLSKIEAGRLELDRRNFDLRELVDQTLQVFAVPAHSKGLEIAAHVDPETPRWLVGDPDRLRQVIVNLLGNAVKFTDEGEVVLNVEPVGPEGGEAQGEAEGEDAVLMPDEGPAILRFSVRDTGPGIPEDQLESIFERFKQVDSSSTRRHGGTGLGLTISAALADAMGGEIWVESELGQGSTFAFTARFGRGVGPEQQPSEGVSLEDITGLRILVVDDNATNRLILQEMLASWGAHPRVVPGGGEALEELREARDSGAPYELVLLDGQMPGMDGFQVAEAIKKDPSLAGLTLMMLTSAGTRDGQVEEARSLGIEEYMVKPIRRARLLEAIRGTLTAVRGSGSGGEEEEAEEEGKGEVPRGRHVLLVEDAEENRMLIAAYLKRTPHELDIVENGREAVEAVKNAPERYDLVFMDVQMPVMDGYEATRQIRAWEAAEARSRLPIVALTAHALESERRKSEEAGCDAHVTKPIKKKELLMAIRTYASGPEARAEASETAGGSGHEG